MSMWYFLLHLIVALNVTSYITLPRWMKKNSSCVSCQSSSCAMYLCLSRVGRENVGLTPVEGWGRVPRTMPWLTAEFCSFPFLGRGLCGVWVCPSFQWTNFVPCTKWKLLSVFCFVCFSGLLIYWSSELNWLIEGIDMRSEGCCECSAGSGATHFSNRKLVNWFGLSLRTAVYSNSVSLNEKKGLFFYPLKMGK